MKMLKRFNTLLKRTGMYKMFIGFIISYFIVSLVLFLVEPGVKSYGDGLWFCFVSFTTIGFGDITAVTMIGRIMIIFITVYAIVVTAMIPGVVVSYYLEFLKIKENDTISTFLEKLENLSELSKEELDELSERVKQYNKAMSQQTVDK